MLEYICIIVILSFAKAYNYLGEFAVKLFVKRNRNSRFVCCGTSDGNFYGGNSPYRDYKARQIYIDTEALCLNF